MPILRVSTVRSLIIKMATNSYQSQTLFCQTLFFKGGFREIVLVLLLLEQSDTDDKSIVSEVMAIFRRNRIF